MITFKAEIERFEKMGEKTGWTYIAVPAAIAEQVKAGCKKSFRVKGHLDQVPIAGLSMVPMGEGNFIIALKASLRKELRKQEGGLLQVSLEEDTTFKIEMPEDLEICLADEPVLLERFLSQPKWHRNYYITWLNSAKTEPTRTKRIVKIIEAMSRDWDFGTMIRDGKPPKNS